MNARLSTAVRTAQRGTYNIPLNYFAAQISGIHTQSVTVTNVVNTTNAIAVAFADGWRLGAVSEQFGTKIRQMSFANTTTLSVEVGIPWGPSSSGQYPVNWQVMSFY